MTIMFCSFDKHPIILRLYGKSGVVHHRDRKWDELAGQFPGYPGARQIFELDLDLVQASCGYAVPYYEFRGERLLQNGRITKAEMESKIIGIPKTGKASIKNRLELLELNEHFFLKIREAKYFFAWN